jgi:SAM-dependent methyltransferase
MPTGDLTTRATVKAALRGNMPARYAAPWRTPFLEVLASELGPALQILDVGSGAKPSLSPDMRPKGCEYVGLDLSMHELLRAPPGSYDRVIEADVTRPVAALEGQFDVALSFQVFEHVKPLSAAFANLHSVLKPGGRAIVQLSGTFSFHGIANRLVPHKLAVLLMERLLGRDSESVFPAYYDHCWSTAMVAMLRPWSNATITPLWLGANYFEFSRGLRAGYLAYEEWARRRGIDNLASHYLVIAER